jgi:hypothetical protein
VTPAKPLRQARSAHLEKGVSRNYLTALKSVKSPVFILCALFVFYCAMFLRYRPYDIDNPWFLSFSYNTCIEHVYTDQYMRVAFPGGMDGTHLFGKLAAYTQCFLVGHVGWQQWPAVLVASGFVVLALGFWSMQLHRLGHTQPFISCFLVTVGISEPFLSAANKFRYEFLSFALISLGLLLISYRKPFWGAFVAALAIEIEPMALAGLIPVAALAWDTHKITRGLLGRLAAGLAMAGAVYAILHPDVLHVGEYLTQLRIHSSSGIGGFFAAYFLHRSRHLPELFCFALASFFYWHRRDKIDSHYLGISALALSTFSIAMPHGNPSYMVFLYPFLVATALLAFQADRRALLIAVSACVYFLPQYAVLAYLNRNQGYRINDIRQVSGAIRAASYRLGISDSQLRVYGDYSLWFAHPHHYEAASASTLGNAQDADLYICYEHPIQAGNLTPESMIYCPELRRRFPLALFSAITVRNHEIYLYTKEKSNLRGAN